jgi:hypothetical protein
MPKHGADFAQRALLYLTNRRSGQTEFAADFLVPFFVPEPGFKYCQLAVIQGAFLVHTQHRFERQVALLSPEHGFDRILAGLAGYVRG